MKTRKNTAVNRFDSAVSKTVDFLGSRYFLYITFGLFIFQAIFIAIATKTGLPPDENFHVGLIKLYSESGFSPFLSSQVGYEYLGEVTRSPFVIYHYFLGIPYMIFGDSSFSVFILRAMNIVIATASLFTVYKIGQKIRVPAIANNMTIFMLSNVLMFVYLSASVSYDNLFIFLSLFSTLLVLNLWEKFSLRDFLLLVIVLSAGLLVKINFLPAAIIFVGILCFRYWNQLGASFVIAKRQLFKKSSYLLLAITLLVVSIVGYRYVSNIIGYQDITPRCDAIHSLESCRQNGIFLRAETLDDAGKPQNTRSLPSYTVDWLGLMTTRTLGIFGHKSVEPTPLVIFGFYSFVVAGIIAFIRLFKFSDTRIFLLVIVSGLYLLVLFNQNYSTYTDRGILGLALQGRYAFSVLPLIFLIFNNYIFRMVRTKFGTLVISLFIIVTFITGGAISYIWRTGPEWHTSRTTSINAELKETLTKIIPIEN